MFNQFFKTIIEFAHLLGSPELGTTPLFLCDLSRDVNNIRADRLGVPFPTRALFAFNSGTPLPTLFWGRMLCSIRVDVRTFFEETPEFPMTTGISLSILDVKSCFLKELQPFFPVNPLYYRYWKLETTSLKEV